MNNADMPAMPHDIEFGKGYPLNYDPTGLTKREHFAGLAMQGMISSPIGKVKDMLDGTSLANAAVEQADLLLKALEQDNE